MRELQWTSRFVVSLPLFAGRAHGIDAVPTFFRGQTLGQITETVSDDGSTILRSASTLQSFALHEMFELVNTGTM